MPKLKKGEACKTLIYPINIDDYLSCNYGAKGRLRTWN